MTLMEWLACLPYDCKTAYLKWGEGVQVQIQPVLNKLLVLAGRNATMHTRTEQKMSTRIFFPEVLNVTSVIENSNLFSINFVISNANIDNGIMSTKSSKMLCRYFYTVFT